MRVLFYGDTRGNSGPHNINRGICKYRKDPFLLIQSTSRYGRITEGIRKVRLCDVLVISGVSRLGCILLRAAQVSGKQTVYIMHGSNDRESELNGIPAKRMALKQERYLLKHADLLLPVSRKFQDWVQSTYPQYAEKTKHWYSGIDPEAFSQVQPGEKIPGRIVAAGGCQRIKNNQPLIHAVEALQGKAELRICGVWEISTEGYAHVSFPGQLSHEMFLKELKEAQIFVLNSLTETYSIAAMEALLSGCSVLISGNAGIAEVLRLEAMDRIEDPGNEKEIREKLEWLIQHPNGQRLLSQLDKEAISVAGSLKRLEEICKELQEVKAVHESVLDSKCPV